jgi:O-antigen/teichoic acid export membrane protein
MAPVSHESARSAADDATRGSAIKLGAEILSRLLGLGTTLLLASGLGLADFGAFAGRFWYLALVLAEVAEFGLQATATRALVAGTLSLRSMVRARLASSGAVVAAAALFRIAGASLPGLAEASAVLPPLVLFFVLAGWAEFLGVALRCRGARVQEALLLLLLRAGSPAAAAFVLAAGGGLEALAWSQAASPLPALALGALLLQRHGGGLRGQDAPAAAVLRTAVPLAANGMLQIVSPRVELFALFLLAGDRETGLFLVALRVFEFLSMVPNAVAQGAMPALTREALGGGEAVRQRMGRTMALVAAPAAVGLALVAPGVLGLLFAEEYAPAAPALALLAVALVPLFLNALLSWSIVARGHADWLPRLTGLRVVLAALIASLLVPRLGLSGAAVGLLCAESALLLMNVLACARAAFRVPLLRPLAWALLACLPMAVAVVPLRAHLLAALAAGVATWLATLALAAWLAPSFVRQVTGDFRYPWAP